MPNPRRKKDEEKEQSSSSSSRVIKPSQKFAEWYNAGAEENALRNLAADMARARLNDPAIQQRNAWLREMEDKQRRLNADISAYNDNVRRQNSAAALSNSLARGAYLGAAQAAQPRRSLSPSDLASVAGMVAKGNRDRAADNYMSVVRNNFEVPDNGGNVRTYDWRYRNENWSRNIPDGGDRIREQYERDVADWKKTNEAVDNYNAWVAQRNGKPYEGNGDPSKGLQSYLYLQNREEQRIADIERDQGINSLNRSYAFPDGGERSKAAYADFIEAMKRANNMAASNYAINEILGRTEEEPGTSMVHYNKYDSMSANAILNEWNRYKEKTAQDLEDAKKLLNITFPGVQSSGMEDIRNRLGALYGIDAYDAGELQSLVDDLEKGKIYLPDGSSTTYSILYNEASSRLPQSDLEEIAKLRAMTSSEIKKQYESQDYTDHDTLQEDKNIVDFLLQNADVMRDYPEGSWEYDARERIRKAYDIDPQDEQALRDLSIKIGVKLINTPKAENNEIAFTDSNGTNYTWRNLYYEAENREQFGKMGNDEEALKLMTNGYALLRQINFYNSGVVDEYTARDALEKSEQLTPQLNSIKDQLSAMGYDFDRMAEYLDTEEAKQDFFMKLEADTAFATEHPGLASLYTVLLMPITSLEGIISLAGGIGSGNVSTPIEEYVPLNYFNNYSTNARDTIRAAAQNEIYNDILENTGNEKFASLVQKLYSGVMSVADSRMSLGLCSALFGPLGNDFVEWASLVMMGSSAAGEEFKQQIETGNDNARTLMVSLAAGINEVLFEKISLDKLMEGREIASWDWGDIAGSAKKIIKQSFVQRGIEGSEEVFTTLANLFAAKLTGNTTKYKNNYDALINSRKVSPSEASRIVTKQFFTDLLTEDFLGGFIAGGGELNYITGAIANSQAARNATAPIVNYQQNRGYRNIGAGFVNNENVGELIKQGQMSEYADTRDLANELARNQVFQRTEAAPADVEKPGVSRKQMKDYKVSLGKLGAAVVKENAGKAFNGNQAALKEAIRAELKNNGIEAKDYIVDVVSQVYNGGELSDYGKNIAESVDADKIVEAVKANAPEIQKEAERISTEAFERVKNVQAMANADYSNQVSKTGEVVDTKTGKAVEIGEFVKDGDNGITLTTKDGGRVSVADLQFADTTQAALYEEVDAAGFSPEVANQVVRGFDGKGTAAVSSYMNGMLEGMAYGRTHQNTDMNFSGPFYADLSASQKDLAIKLGQMERGFDTEKATAKINELKALSGGVQRKGSVTGVTSSSAGLNNAQRTGIRTIEMLVDNGALTNNFHFFSSVDNGKGRVLSEDIGGLKKGVAAPNGFYDPKTGDIYIDVNAGNNGEGTVLFTAAHEVTHFVKQWSPNKFNDLANFLVQEYHGAGISVDGLVREQMRKGSSRHLSYDEAFEEMVADSMQTMFTDGNLAAKLMDLKTRDKTLFDKIMDFVKKLQTGINKVYARYTPDSEEAKALSQIKGAVDRLADTFAEGITAATENYNATDASNLSAKEIKDLKAKGLSVVNGLIVADNLEALAAQVRKPGSLNIYSYRTEPEWEKSVIAQWGDTEETRRYINAVRAFTDAMVSDDAIRRVVPMGSYAYSKQGPLRDNVEYVITFDMDTSCPRTFQFLKYRDAIQAYAKRPLTYNESVNLLELMRAFGQNIPCSYCYVENKRVLLSASYNNFFAFRNNVLNEQDAEKAKAQMYGYNEKNGTLAKASQEVFDRWRRDMSYNPTVSDIWEATQTARNSVFNFLDEQLKNGVITTKQAQKKIENFVCDHFGVKGQGPRAEISGIVSEWIYDTHAQQKHTYFLQNNPDVDRVDVRALGLNHEALAYAKSASSAKTVSSYVPYTDQLKNIPQKVKDYVMGMGGIRKHSSNDFRIDYVQDYFMFYADLAAGGWTGHTYTKSTDFVKIFGRTGDRINMSIAMTDGPNGTVRENALEGMYWKDARALRKAYKNAGVMSMVTSDAQLSYALNSDWIDMAIPFHASSLDKKVWYDLRHWFDYTSKQLERFYNSTEMELALIQKALDDAGVEYSSDGMNKELIEMAKKAGAGGKSDDRAKIMNREIKRLKSLMAKNAIKYNTKMSTTEIEDLYNSTFGVKTLYNAEGKRIKPHFLPGETIVDGVTIPGHNNDVNRYLELCREYGVHPRFDGVAVQDKNGNDINVIDHEGYIKLIKETARTDSEQEKIQFNLDEYDDYLKMTPMEYAMKQLEDYAKIGGYENLSEDPMGIKKRFIDEYLGKNRDIGWFSEETQDLIDLVNECQNKENAGDDLPGYMDVDQGANELKYSVRLGMTDEERYNELKDAVVYAPTNSVDEGNTDTISTLEEAENLAVSRATEIIVPLAEKLGIIGKPLTARHLDADFIFSKNGGLRESLHRQQFYGGTYADFAKALMNLDKILQGAELIEQHEDKYKGTVRENERLEHVSVLFGVFKDEEYLIPTLAEIKHLKGNTNRLYMTVAMTKIKEADVLESVGEKDPVQILLSASKYKLADIIAKVNTADARFLKYIPDQMLNDEQRVAKEAALAEDAIKIENIPKKESGTEKLSARDTLDTSTSDGEEVRFSLRTAPAPKKTKTAYKLMRLVDGHLYPLFIGNNERVDIGTWYDADSPNLSMLTELPPGTHLIDMETGEATSWEQYAEEHIPLKNGKRRTKPNVEDIHWANDNGYRFMHIEDKAGTVSATRMQKQYGDTRAYYNWGVNGSAKSDTGEGSASLYALRPGWHFGEVPSMHQIGYGDNADTRLDNQVWVEVEMAADVDYNAEAASNYSGDIPTHIPENGYYTFATNPTQKKTKGGTTAADRTKADWYVSGAFKPVRIISDSEADRIVTYYNRKTGANVPLDHRRAGGRMFNAETMTLEETSADALKFSFRDRGEEVTEGVYISDKEFKGKTGFTYKGAIMSGLKKGETRFEKTPILEKAYRTGDRIAIVQSGTGDSAAYATTKIGKPEWIPASDWDKRRKDHRVPKGSEYDLKEGQAGKWFYPFVDLHVLPREIRQEKNSAYGAKISARDSEGNTLTKAQQDFFKNSKVRDEDGNLRVVYHGTDADFTVFDRTKGRANMDIQGMFFSPWDIDAEGYGPNVKAYYLNITNPAPEGLAYKALNLYKGQNNAGVRAREYLEKRGYDGVNNGNEEFIAFNSEQIKKVDNKKPTSNPDVRFSDREYMNLARNPEANRDRLTELVNVAASMAGYDSVKLYHGTDQFGFTNIRPEAGDDGRSFFATDSLETAKTYSYDRGVRPVSKANADILDDLFESSNGVYQLFANTDGFLHIEGGRNEWDEIPLGKIIDDYNDWHGGEWVTRAKTREIAEFAKNAGYPGVKISHIYDHGGKGEGIVKPASVYVFFNPQEQLKSADLVTYDDNGNVIPLSERFNPVSTDLRYSERDPDSMDTRTVLSNALLDAAQNDVERKYIEDYQSKIQAMNEEQNRLNEIRNDIRNMTFGKAPHTTEHLKSLKEEATRLANRINIYDKQLLRIEAMKPMKAVIARETDKVKQRIRADQAAFMTDYKNRASAREYIARIEHEVKGLRDRLLHPKAKTIIPESFAKPAAEFLAAIDFSTFNADGTRRAGKANATRAELQSRLDALAKSIDNASLEADYGQLDISPDMKTWIDSVKLYLENNFSADDDYVLRKMDAEQLKDLYKMVVALRTAVNRAGKMYTNMSTNVADLGAGTIDYLEPLFNRERSAAGARVFKTLGWDYAQPVTVFDRFGDSGKQVYKGLLSGQKKEAENVQTILDFVDTAYTRDEINKWRDEMHEVTIGGSKYNVPTSYIQELYCMMKDADAKRHIVEGGGIRFDDLTYGKAGRRKTRTFDNTMISEAEVQAMLNMLTPRQKEVADQMQEFMDRIGADWGNEISMTRFGYHAFGQIPNYYPIRTIKQGSEYEAQQKRANIYALLNKSFTKERVDNANNTVIIGDIFKTFSNHMSEMAVYNAWALPVIDTIKWFNYREAQDLASGTPERSVKDAIRKAYGAEKSNPADEYIRRLLESINSQKSGGLSESLAFHSLRMMNRVAVAANIRVAIQQPFSITRAFEMINPRFVRPMKPNTMRSEYQEMVERTSFGRWKGLGYYDVDISRPLEVEILKNSTVVDRVTEHSMVLAELGDQFTWTTLWHACKLEAQHNGLTGEAMINAAAEKFDEVIARTQVVDSVLTKSQWMRSDSFWHRMTSAFMSEPMTSYNALLRRYDQFQRDLAAHGRAYAWKNNWRKIAGSVALYVLTQVVNAMVTAPIDASRDDDDYKTWFEKMLERFKKNALENIIPTSMMPYISDIAEYAIYGSEDRSDLAMYTKVIDTAKQIYALFDKEKYSVKKLHKAFMSSLSMISSLSGLPMSNALRDAIAIWNTVVGEVIPAETTDYGSWKFQTAEDKNTVGYQQFIKALQDDNEDRAGYIYMQMISNGLDDSGKLNDNILTYYRKNASGDADDTENAAMLNKMMTIFGEDDAEATSEEKAAWWEYTGNNPDTFLADAKAYKHYYEKIMPTGISAEVYNDYRQNLMDNGYNLQAEIIPVIDSLDLTREQKDALYTDNGWTKIGLENTPWHASATPGYGDYTRRAMSENLDNYMSAADYREYLAEIEPYGIDDFTWTNYSNFIKKVKGQDTTGDGKNDYTAQQAVMDYIEALPLTDKQKDALYLKKYSEKNIDKAPWRQ